MSEEAAPILAPAPLTEPLAIKALTTMSGHEAVFMAKVKGRLISPRVGPATDIDLARFTDWSDVEDLWLNRSHITDAGLTHLKKAPKLSHLDLAQTPITDDGLIHLRERKFFYTLNLCGTEITDSGLRYGGGIPHGQNGRLSRWRVNVLTKH